MPRTLASVAGHHVASGGSTGSRTGKGAISELKRSGAGRARCRSKLQIQLLLAATPLNLKRLTTHAPAAANQAAGEDHGARAQLAILTTCLRALAAIDAATSTTGFYSQWLA